MNKKSLCIQLTCLVTGLFFATVAFAQDQDIETQKQYTIEGNYFKCELPDGWSINRSKISDEAEKVYGVWALGPRTKEGVAVMITVDYYSMDNTLFKSPAEFIKRNTTPGPIKIEGDRYSPVKTIKVANRNAKSFEKETSIFLPPNTPWAREIAIKEKKVVLPASEGFYVLLYYAQASVYEKYFPWFERVLKSFTPIRALDAANQSQLVMAQAPRNAGVEENNVVMEWEGQYSSQEEPLVQIVTSERGDKDSLGWRNLCKKASPSSEAPTIDFDKYVVACVFLGRRLTGGYWIEFGKPYIKDNRMVIPYKERKPTGFVTQALSYPYRMKVFERPAGKEVVLEEIQ